MRPLYQNRRKSGGSAGAFLPTIKPVEVFTLARDEATAPGIAGHDSLAAVSQVLLLAIFIVAVGAGFGERTGCVRDFVLILGLSRLVGRQCRIAKALHELGPIWIFQRDIDPIRAFPPRDHQQVRSL